MRKFSVIVTCLFLTSAIATECHRYNIVEKNERPEHAQNYSPTGVVENYLGLGFVSDKELIPALITQKELNHYTLTTVESVSKIIYQGCETQVAELGNGGNWGSILSLSSFKTWRGKVICTYSSSSNDLRFVTCKI